MINGGLWLRKDHVRELDIEEKSKRKKKKNKQRNRCLEKLEYMVVTCDERIINHAQKSHYRPQHRGWDRFTLGCVVESRNSGIPGDLVNCSPTIIRIHGTIEKKKLKPRNGGAHASLI